MENGTEPAKILRFKRVAQKQSGTYRADSYTNVMNNYGTQKDTTEHYHFQAEAPVPDDVLTMYYESNGLFAKIIDAPAEEAVKHGFKLDINDQELEKFYTDALDALDWEGAVMTAIKWTRLFGGCIIVMLVDDGRGLEEPLDWNNVTAIESLRIFDRSIVQEDTSAIYSFAADDENAFRSKADRLGMPQYYDVYSRYGTFRVHESRCLIFQNGILPENTSNSTYQMWGIPEYTRINRAVRDAEVAHGSAVKLLDRSVQAVYKMRGLSAELATEKGEDRVLKRLQAIDMARGLMNSILIDADGEDYDFKTFQFTGVSDVIDTTCNYLSALTNIPQTVLFGRSPSGMNSTGESDLENWYSYVERIQKRMIKKNLRYLLAVIFHIGKHNGTIEEIPPINIEFNPLWSMSDSEKADLEQKRASAQQTRAQTAQLYMDAQVLDPQEVRRKLAASDEFDIETVLDDIPEDDLFADMPDMGGATPTNEMFGEEADPAPTPVVEEDSEDTVSSAAVLLVRNGKILTGTRQEGSHRGQVCGPGGHIEEGETPEQAAVRETQEEFGITPKNLTLLGYGPTEPDGMKPAIYLATEYEGDFKMADGEMANPCFCSIDELVDIAEQLFPPFADSLDLLLQSILPEMVEDKGTDKKGEMSGMSGDVSTIKTYLKRKKKRLTSRYYEAMKNGDTEKAVKLSQSILATQRMDDDVDAWVTINGAHVPLDESGTAIGGAGGAFTGQNLSQAHAASKAASAERAAAKAAKAAAQGSSSSGHTIAEGKDISASYTGSRDTKSVIEAQGFGGLPRVVSSDEFDAAVEASGFVGERIYLASSEKVLEAYQDALYNGDFYVDCTEGGSVYGQGMYCASSYSGEITDDMEGQMGYYSQIGSIRCMQDGEKEYATTLKASDFEDEGFSVTDEQVAVAGRFVTEKGLKVRDLSADEKAAYTSLRKSGQLKDLKTAIDDKIYHDFVIGYEAPSIVEKVTLDTSAKIATYSELKAQQNSSSDAAAKSMDTGAYAAMLGYDAIHVDVASSGGSKADETVILNRTKLIIEDNRGRSDSADENAPISFAEGENGCLYAIQNGKVIGFIDISCSTETKGDQ